MAAAPITVTRKCLFISFSSFLFPVRWASLRITFESAVRIAARLDKQPADRGQKIEGRQHMQRQAPIAVAIDQKRQHNRTEDAAHLPRSIHHGAEQSCVSAAETDRRGPTRG